MWTSVTKPRFRVLLVFDIAIDDVHIYASVIKLLSVRLGGDLRAIRALP